MKIAPRFVPCFISIALTAAPLAAGSTSGTMAVAVIIEESCLLDARPMDFGVVPGQPDRADARSSLLLTCTPDASYLVTLDNGSHGADGIRRMADATGTAFQAYELYSDAARTRRWGAAMASATGMIAPASGQTELPVFARLEGGLALPGAYADTVTVTVAF